MDFNLERFMTELEEVVNIDSGSYDIEGLNQVAQWFAKKYEEAGYYTKVTYQGDIQRPHILATTHNPEEFADKDNDGQRRAETNQCAGGTRCT